MLYKVGCLEKLTKLDRKKLYTIKCLLFCGMYFARDILGIGIGFYIIYLVTAIICITMTSAELLVFLLSISSFANAGFDGVFAIAFLAIVYLKCFPNMHRINRKTILIPIVCGYELIHYFISDYTNDIGVYITYICLLLSLFFLLQQDLSSVNKAFALKSFMCFSLFFVLMSILITARLYPTFSDFFKYGFRNQEYVTILQENSYLIANANFITSICSLNLGISLLLVIHEKNKIPYIIAFVIFFVCGLLTISKMFVAIIGLFIVYSTYAIGRSNLKKMIILIIAYVVAAILVFHFFRESLIDGVLARFRIEELTTGRMDIVSDMIEMLNNQPSRYAVGVGLLNLQNAIGNAVHGSLFEILGGWGIAGFVLSGMFIFSAITMRTERRVVAKKNNRYINWLPIVIYLVYSLIGMLFSSAMAIIRLFICSFAIEYGVQEGNR